ncbi:precorrin-6A synthase (deacetylating), partial [Streptomyces sp. NPDC006386]
LGPQPLDPRGEARERKGWIMDTYLLRRNPRD